MIFDARFYARFDAGRFLFSLALLVLLASSSWASDTTQVITLGNDVTTDTTIAAQVVPNGMNGYKSVYGQVVCSSGACTQTQKIYGTSKLSDTTNGILLCTLTLSGTTRAQDACPVMQAVFVGFYLVTSNTAGTAASGSVILMYGGPVQ